jgi:hypothetical protein
MVINRPEINNDGGHPFCDPALSYAARGWHVLRVSPRGKNPVDGSWQTIATIDPATIERWFARGARWNLGVQLGPRSGIFDVECDTPEAERELGALLADDAPVVPTFQGKRGKHRLFLHTPNLPRPGKAVFKYRGIEFRTGNGGKGAQSLFPPSLHPDGPVYTWLVHPDDADPVPFPARALEIVSRALGADAPEGAPDPDEPIRQNGRNTRLTSMAGSMRRAGFNRAEIEAALLAVNLRRCKPPLGEAEVKGIARKISRYAPNEPRLARIVRTGKIAAAERHRLTHISFSMEVS